MANSILNTLGVGSGMDTAAIIEALVNAEKAPQESQLNKRISSSEATISGFGTLTSALSTLKDSLASLADASEIESSVNVNSSADEFFVSSADSPAPGSYSVQVTQLAIGDRFTAELGDPDDELNGGVAFDIDVTFGSPSTTTTVSVTDTTPAGVVDALNAADIPLSARMVDTGDDSIPSKRYKILLTGEVGAENSMTISSTVASFAKPQVATDARVVVDGIAMYRGSNTFSDVVPGMTITAMETQASASTIQVVRNDEAVVSAMQNFVDTFNSFNEVANALADPDSALDGGGTLAADSTLRSIVSKMRNMVLDESSVTSGDITHFTSLGVSFTRSGTLEFDTDVMRAALTSNFSDVITTLSADRTADSIASDDPKGLAGDIVQYIEDLIDDGGLIDNRVTTAEDQIDRYEDDLKALEEKMVRIEQRYVAQFTAMEQAVDRFESLRESLKSQFENMPFTNSNN